MKTYTISILLTEYLDFTSRCVYYLTGRGYTHASISVDEPEEIYYSFNKKGFRMERPHKYKDMIRKSICYKLDATEEEYLKIMRLIEEFQECRQSWRYSLRGVILCVLQIPHKIERHYFCSQFVAELLQKSKIVGLKENASLYNPNKLGEELRTCFRLREIVVNPL